MTVQRCSQPETGRMCSASLWMRAWERTRWRDKIRSNSSPTPFLLDLGHQMCSLTWSVVPKLPWGNWIIWTTGRWRRFLWLTLARQIASSETTTWVAWMRWQEGTVAKAIASHQKGVCSQWVSPPLPNHRPPIPSRPCTNTMIPPTISLRLPSDQELALPL